MRAADRVPAGERHDLLVVEPHAPEHLAQVGHAWKSYDLYQQSTQRQHAGGNIGQMDIGSTRA